MLFKTSKINEFRLWGLLLTLAGMASMIFGLAGIVFDWGTVGKVVAFVFAGIGTIVMIGSVGVYFWAGMLSTSAVVVECPECGRQTKILGKTDRCMFCKTILSVDPRFAPGENKTTEGR